MARIHQFSPAIAVGDGVSGGVLLTQSLLRELGHESQLYVQHCDEDIRDLTRSFTDFNSDKCDLLLVHHSMGHELEDWLTGLPCPLSMIYHNITPAEFFQPGSAERYYATLGREQLARWSGHFGGAIGASALNRSELERLGYSNTCVIPLVVSHARLLNVRAVAPPEADEIKGQDILLCVGRIAENKRQHLLLQALWHLSSLTEKLPMLIIAGGVTSPAYQRQLEDAARRLGLSDRVLFTGKCPDAELRWYYERARALWCASAHEGFCVPLIEANEFGVPPLAFAHASIPDTLGQSGLLIEQDDPAVLAAVTAALLQDPSLVATLKTAGRQNLGRFEHQTLKTQLATFISARLRDAAQRAPAPA